MKRAALIALLTSCAHASTPTVEPPRPALAEAAPPLPFQLALQRGALQRLSALAFDARSSRLAVASADGVIVIWDLHELAPARTVRHPDGTWVRALFFLDDHELLACSEFDRPQRWDLETGALTQVPVDLGQEACAVSPDGKLLALASGERNLSELDPWSRISVVEIHTGAVVATMEGHHRVTWRLAFSPDATLLVSGGFSGEATVWEVATGARIADFRGHAQNVHAVGFAADGRTVVSADQAGITLRWDPVTGEPVASRADDAAVLARVPGGEVAQSADDRWRASVHWSGHTELTATATDARVILAGTQPGWIAASETGAYDGDDAGPALVAVVQGLRGFDLRQFPMWRDPAALRAHLEGRPIRVRDVAGACTLDRHALHAPQARVTKVKHEPTRIRVVFEARAERCALQRYEIRVDGNLDEEGELQGDSARIVGSGSAAAQVIELRVWDVAGVTSAPRVARWEAP